MRAGLAGAYRLIVALAVALLTVPAAARAGCVWSDLVADTERVVAVRADAPRADFVQDGGSRAAVRTRAPPAGRRPT